ncbi:DUF2612 domain-containing protein [Campylobacter jejuni]
MNEEFFKLMTSFIDKIAEDVINQYQDAINQIQAQYRETNIKELIEGIIEIKKKFVINAYISLIKDNISLSTAKGDSLDLWGYLLGTNRYIPTDPSEQGYNFFNFDKKRFFQLIFYNPLKPSYASLNDVDFRKMLLLLLQKQFIFPSVKKTNDFLSSFFSDYGGISIGDNTDMSFKVYYFKKQIPTWLSYFLEYRDILPRPAGVGYNFEVDENYYFGFETDNTEWNEKYLGNFYKTNFIKFSELEKNKG